MFSAIRRLMGSSQSGRKQQEEEDIHEIPRSSPPLRTGTIEEENQQSPDTNVGVGIEPPKEKKKRKRKTKSSGQEEIIERNVPGLEYLQLELQNKLSAIGDSFDMSGGAAEVDVPIEPMKPDRKRASKRKEPEEQPAEDEPHKDLMPAKPKRPRKSRAKSIVEVPSDLSQDIDIEEGEAQGSKPNTTAQDDLQDSSIPVKHKKSRRSLAKNIAVIIPVQNFENMGVVGNEEQSSLKASKGKRKKPKTTSNEVKVHEFDTEDLVSQESSIHAEQQILAEVSGISREHEPAHEHNGSPLQLSDKALIKRKASDTVPETISKPKRARKSSGTPGMSLLDLGFSKERSGSQMATENLVRTAKDLYLQSTIEVPETSPKLPPDSKGKLKSKAKAPIMFSGSGATATPGRVEQRATPQFTPVNRKPKQGPSRSLQDDTQVSENRLENTDDPSKHTQSSPSKSNQKRKRRLPVDIQDGGDEIGKSQGIFSSPATESASPRKPRTSKDPLKNGPPRKGKLTFEQLGAIDRAVQTYRQMHDLTQFKMNELIQSAHGSVESKNFWQSVRDAIPELPHRKVYDTCRRQFHNFECRGSWTKEQDEELRDAYARFPQKWKQIGELINRFPEDVRDRWRNYLICGDKLRKDYWDKEEEDQLREVVADCVETLRENRRLAKEPSIGRDSLEALVDWQVVSQKMNGVRSRLQCSGKWKQIKEREDSNDERLEAITTTDWRAEEATREAQTMSGVEILQLLVAIRDSGAGKESNIPWLLITEALQKLGKRMALKVCFRQLRSRVPGGKEMHFKEILETLITEFEASQPDIPGRYVDTKVIREVKKRPNRHLVDPHYRVSEETETNGPRKVQRRTNRLKHDTQVEGENALSSKDTEKRAPKSVNDKLVEELEVIDHGEGSSKSKKKSKPTVEPSMDGESIEQNETATQIPAKKKPRKSKTQPDVTANEDDEQLHRPVPKKRKKKLNEGLKQQDESQGQEAVAEQEDRHNTEDIIEIFQSLKKAPKMRKGKQKNLEDILGEEIAYRRNRGSANRGEEYQEDNWSALQFSEEQHPEINDTPTFVYHDNQDAAEPSSSGDESDTNGHHRQTEANPSDDEDIDNASVQEGDDASADGPSNYYQEPETNGFNPRKEATLSGDQEFADTPIQHIDDEDAKEQSEDDQESEFNGCDRSLEFVNNENLHTIPSEQSDEELEENDQAQAAYDEKKTGSDDGVIYTVHKASTCSSSDEEEDQALGRAESVDLDTLTPLKRTSVASLSNDLRPVTVSSPSNSESDPISDSDSNSMSDELSQQTQFIGKKGQTLGHEIAQYGEEEEIDQSHDMESDREQGRYPGQDQPFSDGSKQDHAIEDEQGLFGESVEETEPAHSSRLRTTISPDLDAAVNHDGHRTFRARAKRVNYDDTAHLLAGSDESESSDNGPPPKVKGTKARVNGRSTLKNGVKPYVNGFQRSDNASSSDYSIPAEATPKHIRVEREYEEPVEEEPEKIGWEASDLPKPKRRTKKSTASERISRNQKPCEE
jgi:hypothetical protein